MLYNLTIAVDKVSGFQVYQIEAESEEEAIQLFQNGEGEPVDEELEIMSLDLDSLEISEA